MNTTAFLPSPSEAMTICRNVMLRIVEMPCFMLLIVSRLSINHNVDQAVDTHVFVPSHIMELKVRSASISIRHNKT